LRSWRDAAFDEAEELVVGDEKGEKVISFMTMGGADVKREGAIDHFHRDIGKGFSECLSDALPPEVEVGQLIVYLRSS
jgi:hypothetical protein